MKRIMVLFTAVMTFAAIVFAQDYTGQLENDPIFPKVIDISFEMEKLTNGGVDSTLFVLHPTVAAADTEQSKMHHSIGYTFIMPEMVTAEAGSVSFRVIVRNGFKNSAGTYIMAPVDSFTVTTANQDSVLSTAISIPGGKYFDVLCRTITGTAFSQATTFRLHFRRYR